MTAPKARPTEYKGIRYRSKSEAMFARYLELELEQCERYGGTAARPGGATFSSGGGGFFYEPAFLEVGGWRPDFLVWRTRAGIIHGMQMPVTEYSIIEYKPSRPTETYAEEFAKRCEVALDRLSSPDLWWFSRRCECAIFWGSVFTHDRGRVFAEEGACYFPDEGDWLAKHETKVRETRFDIESRPRVDTRRMIANLGGADDDPVATAELARIIREQRIQMGLRI